jgi:hypothetical protein
MRSFVQFDGEGEAANARPRAIGGHPAVVVTELCRRKAPGNPYADRDGYVLFGQLVDYSAGRSNGCTSWSPSDSEWILALVKDRPTTLYIYPESTDIVAVTRAVKAGRSPPRADSAGTRPAEKSAFRNFTRETLEPILVQYRKDHPAPPPR